MTHISIGGVQLDEIRMELNKISNELHQINENTRLHCGDITDLKFANEIIDEQRKAIKILKEENEELKKRLSDLQKENYGNIDGIAFYQEENATLCEKISDLEYENEELKEKLNEDDKMRWSKKTENTVQDIDGEEYNIQEIVNALNHYQRTVDELRRENYELYNRVNENTNNIK